jgi:hypothetical protein
MICTSFSSCDPLFSFPVLLSSSSAASYPPHFFSIYYPSLLPPATLPCVSLSNVGKATQLTRLFCDHNLAPPHFPATDPRARIANTYGVEETLWASAQTTSTDEAEVLLESSLKHIRGAFPLIVPQIVLYSGSQERPVLFPSYAFSFFSFWRPGPHKPSNPFLLPPLPRIN